MKSHKEELNTLNFEVVDWFDELSEDQQTDVLEALAEADSGDIIPHSEALKIFEKWGLK